MTQKRRRELRIVALTFLAAIAILPLNIVFPPYVVPMYNVKFAGDDIGKVPVRPPRPPSEWEIL